MGTTRAAIMLVFILGMHKDWTINTLIFIGSTLVPGVSLWLARSQTTIDDVSRMRAMIADHSIATLTSERVHIIDPQTGRWHQRSARKSAR
jgi:hypothetical protein